MQTITPEYAEMNRLLHVDPTSKYGTGSYRWDGKVISLREETDSQTVLDYGCGKGMLGTLLGCPSWYYEYDPAVEGKQTLPVNHADLVVCTDVLEHVEPELLDNVLRHIAKIARKAVFLVIAMRPADKILPDGRNAHLIQENAAWWRTKLSQFFYIASWESDGGELSMTGSPIRGLGEIIPKSAVSEDIRYAQAVRNCGAVSGRVHPNNQQLPRHDGRVSIVCYGPSLEQTWHSLRFDRRAYGAKIVSVSGAHDFLIERGIIPDIHMDCDPREHKAWFTRNSHPDVDYWVASCCHPKMIDNLISNNRKVALWHVFNGETDRKIGELDGPDPDSLLICGGGTIGCRAINVMYTLGYRTFTMYGMDCSFGAEGQQHAGPHSGKKQTEWGELGRGGIKCGDRWFRSSGTMVYTARGFIDNMRTLERAAEANNEPCIEGTNVRVEFFLHGDGLLQEMARLMSETPTHDRDSPSCLAQASA